MFLSHDESKVAWVWLINLFVNKLNKPNQLKVTILSAQFGLCVPWTDLLNRYIKKGFTQMWKGGRGVSGRWRWDEDDDGGLKGSSTGHRAEPSG